MYVYVHNRRAGGEVAHILLQFSFFLWRYESHILIGRSFLGDKKNAVVLRDTNVRKLYSFPFHWHIIQFQ